MKKITAVFGSCLFFFIIMSMYLVLDQFSANLDKDSFLRETERAAKSVAQIRKEVEKLEDGLDFSNRVIDTMNEKVDDLVKPKKSSNQDDPIKFVPENNQINSIYEGEEMCLFTKPKSGHNQDINMLDFFDKIPFDDQNGGVWKQGWDLQYTEDSFKEKKLLVFVMPHSHNDPGWIKTLDKYFMDQTRHIVSNIVNALAKNENRKFIWAETSYFSMWWAQASTAEKQMAQEQIRNGQLEIVTGGWVMNDEANPHYFNMLDQMVEGHQWLKNHVGVKPKYGWAIDPFGYSSTMPYLLKRMDFKGMLIQRVHYNVKKHLALEKSLEFMWRQNWDSQNTSDIFTHVMPFYSYDVPHTCGPDPMVCCQFDFRRLPGGGIHCPWHAAPKAINSANVKERSELLLDQYRKKAQIYRSNVVLAPLGDDFRYEKTFETQHQFDNYEAIMEYVNSHKELNAEIKFGTLKDYFTAVAERQGGVSGESIPGIPSLGGDFFTYADRADHYWSGYFTSRSFLKHMDRELAAHLRAAEIIFSLAHSCNVHHNTFPGEVLYQKMLIARTELAVFQHHDGITGTAKDHVVTDYGNRMLRALQDSVKIMESSINFLLTKDKNHIKEKNSNIPVVELAESRDNFDQIPMPKVVILSNEPKSIVFYNSLAQERRQVATVFISDPFVQVFDMNNDIIPHQVNLIWKTSREAISNKYELSFVVITPPLGVSRYQIKRDTSDTTNSLSTTDLYHVTLPDGIKHFKLNRGPDTEIKIKNSYFEAVFDSDTGMLIDIGIDGGELKKANIRFMKYGTVASKDRSGAYLFLPDGQATSILEKNQPIVVIKGKLYSEVITRISHVIHRVRVYHADVAEAASLDIKNVLDIRDTSNFELVMRVETGVKNIDKEFFTDLNAFQMQRRKSLKKLPLQANFYPVPAQIFVQDSNTRVSLQTQQSNGGASLEQGYLEVVLDRRLNQDDHRGLGQGVLDNKITPSNFGLLFENFAEENTKLDHPAPIAYPSSTSNILSQQLQHPMLTFLFTPNDPSSYHSHFA